MADELDLLQGTGRRFYVPASSDTQQYYDMHDSTGSGISSSAPVSDADVAEDVYECQTALENCYSNSRFLKAKIGTLEAENEVLTDIANGTPGSCTSAFYAPGLSNTPWVWQGTICVEGVSGALTASLAATYSYWFDDGGPGSGTTRAIGYFIDSTHTRISSAVFFLSYGYQWEDESSGSEAFTANDTSTLAIPATAIGMDWDGTGGLNKQIGVTYF